MSAKYFQGAESALASPPPVPVEQPKQSSEVATLVWLATFVPSCVAWFYALPLIQALTIPVAAGGTEGPWIIRPNLLAHVLGTLFLAAISAQLVYWWCCKKWNIPGADFAQMSMTKRVAVMLCYFLILKYLVVSGTFLVLYLGSWGAVTPEGIEVHLPWATRIYPFAQVHTLGLESRQGLRFTSPNDKYGYQLQFTDGRDYTFNLKHEGLTESELSAIVKYIADETDKKWRPIPKKAAKRRKR